METSTVIDFEEPETVRVSDLELSELEEVFGGSKSSNECMTMDPY